MKKILALIIAVVMIFSVAAIPSTAGVADSAQGVVDNYNDGNYGAALESAFSFAKDLAKAIHSLVGGILGVLDKECPFCDEIHKTKADDADKDDCTCEGECTCGKGDEEEATTAPDVEEPTTEEPTTEEPTTEEPTTEEPTTEEPTTEEPTTEESTTEEPTTEEPTTEEPTTEEPTTEEPTTEEPTTEEPTTEEPTTEEPTTEEPTTEEPTTEAPAVKYETYFTQIKNSTIAADKNFNYTTDGKYPMNVDVALYFWNRNYKANTVTIKNMATAYVNAAVYISDESVGINTIVFAGGNNFHSNNGVFKLIVNTTDIPVKVKLSGTNKIGSTVLTTSNIGDYIVGPYTLA